MSNYARQYRNLYGAAAWESPKHGMSKAVLARNPICQAVEDGQQCRNAATVVHHIIDHGGDPAKFYDWKNVVAVCKHHHPSGPGDPGAVMYMATNGMNGERYEHGVQLDEQGNIKPGQAPPNKDGLRIIAYCGAVPIYGR
jgi:hypothetical protein